MSDSPSFWQRLNPWAGERAARADREQRRDTNASVASTHETLANLRKKRRFLQLKADKLKTRAMSAAEPQASQLVREWRALNTQITQLNGVLSNVQGVHSAMDSTATNVQAFHAMQDAQRGMQHMTQQVNSSEVDRTMAQLQRSMGQGRHVARAMTQPLDWGNDDVVDEWTQKDTASEALLDQWRLEASEAPTRPQAVSGTPLHPASQTRGAVSDTLLHPAPTPTASVPNAPATQGATDPLQEVKL